MKKLLAKFFISDALNRGTALPRFWRKQVSRSAALQDYERSVQAVHERLREPARPAEMPASLHASIMEAVRGSKAGPRQEATPVRGWRTSPRLGWGWAAALVLVSGLGLWFALSPPGRPSAAAKAPLPEVASASALPGMGRLMDQFTTNGAALLSRPLDAQIEGFSRDMREAARFLMASLP